MNSTEHQNRFFGENLAAWIRQKSWHASYIEILESVKNLLHYFMNLEGVKMARRIIMKRQGSYLACTDSDSQEVLASLGRDELVSVQIIRPRNIKHHRKFFKMVGEVFKAQSSWKDQDDMLDDIKIALGHCRERVRADGTVSYASRSISFAQMHQAAFEIFYNQFLDYCIQVIIPGVNKDDFERHLYSIMDGVNYEEKMR